MSNSQPVINSRPFHSKEYKDFRFIAFWSNKITEFVKKISKTTSNPHVTHRDLLVKFINKEYLSGMGEVDHKKRIQDSKHDDLTLPSNVIEFKFRSDALKSLPSVLRTRKDIFERNDHLYFAYFRRRGWKFKTKIIKTQNCIYYLIVIIFPREIISLDLKNLLKEVIKEEMEFTKEVASKGNVDLDDEELYAVGNMIKEIKLERELEEKDKVIKENAKVIEENTKVIEEKDKEIERLKAQLKSK